MSDAERFWVKRPDGSAHECDCGSTIFRMLQNKLPNCAVIACDECGTTFFGATHETKEKAQWN